ncbi:MAG: SRPBCC family protein [Acidimicrobiales bacterium]
MIPQRGSIRRQVRVTRPAADVWALVGDPARLAEWFPGITSVIVTGDHRQVTTAAGITFDEDLLTVDPLARRFQYRVTGGLFREHLGTLDVVDLGDGTSLVLYATDADPATLALVVGGAAGAGIERARRMLEEETDLGQGA